MLNNQTGSSKEVTRMTWRLLLCAGDDNDPYEAEGNDEFRAGSCGRREEDCCQGTCSGTEGRTDWI